MIRHSCAGYEWLQSVSASGSRAWLCGVCCALCVRCAELAGADARGGWVSLSILVGSLSESFEKRISLPPLPLL